MNISYRWLQALAPSITDSPEALSKRLGMLGAPVDELVELGAEIKDIVIARVDDLRAHPNADRLRICTVDTGTGSALQIVCGAPNVEAGRYYPLAPVGASLPGGIKIRKAKLRGEVSEGMLCSAKELGLGKDSAGLMALEGEWKPGAPLVEQLGLDDARLVIDITPNRPDLLSHVGVAREVAPHGVEDIELPAFPNAAEVSLQIDREERGGEVGGVRVRIEDAEGCPRYMAAVVRGVKIGPSPEWLASRLRSVGVHPINNVVDATNYVLFELGQPLHAFDLARLGGSEVRVRRADAGESIRTLDGVDRTLDAEVLVIADQERPVALAGVMGGEESEVTAETTDLFLECALFDEMTVRKAARKLGLSTDASYRFERGVDPEGLPRALRRVVELITAIAGGEPEDRALDLTATAFTRRRVGLRPARVERLLGVAVSEEEIEGYLRPLGFAVERAGDSLQIEVPGYRPDVTREVDLIEEVARRRGYDSFPERLAAFRPSTASQDPMVLVQQHVRDLFTRWGFLEARTAAFAPESEVRVPLLNPLSAEESHLRDRLVPGLLRRLEHNWAHGVRDVRLFEIGTVFRPGEGREVPEEIRVAAVFTGGRRPPHWSGEAGAWDVWDLKGLLRELALEVGGGAVVADEAGEEESSLLDRLELRTEDEAVLGSGGRAATSTLDAPAWAEPVWVLEVQLPPEAATAPPRTYQTLPEFPAVERDLALLVPQGVSAEAIEQAIREAAGDFLEAVWPFDLYAGKGVPEGKRSLAWRLRFRRPERTLTDAEVDRAVEDVLKALGDRLGVERR